MKHFSLITLFVVGIFLVTLRCQAHAQESTPGPSGAMWTEQHSGIEFIKVEGGCFIMGDSLNQGDPDEQPATKVCVDGFYIAKYETTQGHWKAVMGHNPSYVKEEDNYPVEWVSWDDAVEFTLKLSSLTGKQFRLPTEAEWEFAARAGGNDLYAGSDDVDQVAWYNANSGLKAHPVGTKKPNAFGIHDMSGNVWEWCHDWYDRQYYSNRPDSNPPGAAEGSAKVSRGGGWVDVLRYIRVANRGGYAPTNRSNVLGFRVLMPINQ